jgi:hypothetical protein
MMYSATLQNLRMKYIISSLQKNDKFWQILEVSKSALFVFSDPQICEFCTAQNAQSFELLFFSQWLSTSLSTSIFFVHIFFETIKC